MHVGCSSLTEPIRCGTMVLVPTMHVGCSAQCRLPDILVKIVLVPTMHVGCSLVITSGAA